MKISTVAVSRTIQLKQYEPVTITYTAELAEGDDVGVASRTLLAQVKNALYHASGKMRHDLAPPLAEEMAPLFEEEQP